VKRRTFLGKDPGEAWSKGTSTLFRRGPRLGAKTDRSRLGWQSLVLALPVTGSEAATRHARVQIGGRPDTSGDSWNDPHFEKDLLTQAQAIRVYAAIKRRKVL
jgi:hypothetical protein